MTIDLITLRSKIKNGQKINFSKPLTYNITANTFQSLAFASGTPSAATLEYTNNVSGSYHTNGTAFPCLKFNTPSTGSLYIANAKFTNSFPTSTISSLIIYDRIWTSRTVPFGYLTVYNHSAGDLPRYETGQGLQPWIEINRATAFDNTITFRMTYINTNNETKVSDTVFAFTNYSLTTMFPLNLSGNDQGIKKILSTQCTDQSSTGYYQLTLIKPLIFLSNLNPQKPNQDLNFLNSGLVSIHSASCIQLIVASNNGITAADGVIQGSITIVNN